MAITHNGMRFDRLRFTKIPTQYVVVCSALSKDFLQETCESSPVPQIKLDLLCSVCLLGRCIAPHIL